MVGSFCSLKLCAALPPLVPSSRNRAVESGLGIYPSREYIWTDDRLVGVIDEQGNIHEMHTDHLGTPRAVVADDGTLLWNWQFDQNPFGEALPNENPESSGTSFELNLRFPGQYYDFESGLHYNYLRDYEAGVGRYVQSDPIGLDGGSGTFGYVDSKPILFFDIFGLICDARQVPVYEYDFVSQRLIQTGFEIRRTNCRRQPIDNSKHCRDCDLACEVQAARCQMRRGSAAAVLGTAGGLLLVPEPTASKVCGIVLVVGGGVAAIGAAFCSSDAVECKREHCRDICP